MSGRHHLCPEVQPTIIGHRGGFATHIRVHWAWAIPLPEKLNVAEAGPLLCRGVTVFAPLAMYGKPTDRIGIIGIGGLGHMAVKFAAAYGCEVTAFTSSERKVEGVGNSNGLVDRILDIRRCPRPSSCASPLLPV